MHSFAIHNEYTIFNAKIVNCAEVLVFGATPPIKVCKSTHANAAIKSMRFNSLAIPLHTMLTTSTVVASRPSLCADFGTEMCRTTTNVN